MRAPDVQAAITVLGRRTALATDPPLDLSDSDLSVGSFVQARLQGVNLIGALLAATDFTGAQYRTPPCLESCYGMRPRRRCGD